MATRKRGATGSSTPPTTRPTKPEAPSSPEPKTKAIKGRSPRTASGKRGNPAQLAAAQAEATDWLRERTAEGHRAAGRTPPSERGEPRPIMSARRIDDDLRDVVGPITEDEKLLQLPGQRGDFTRTDTWR
ncbi:MAG: hypothetical protein ABI141_08980, partial [Gemmatimonadaceae bacterium]